MNSSSSFQLLRWSASVCGYGFHSFNPLRSPPSFRSHCSFTFCDISSSLPVEYSTVCDSRDVVTTLVLTNSIVLYSQSITMLWGSPSKPEDSSEKPIPREKLPPQLQQLVDHDDGFYDDIYSS